MFMTRPNSKSPSRFNSELRPSVRDISLADWALSTLLGSGPLVNRVHTLCSKFISENTHYFTHCTEDQIPQMIKASKERSSKLVSYLQSIMILLNQGYSCCPMTKDLTKIKSNYKIRFATKVVGYDPTFQLEPVELDIDITNHPRHYRYLYDAINIVILDGSWRSEDVSRLCVILQSLAYDYESVNLTDSEVYDAEQEFISAALSKDCWRDDSLLSKVMTEVASDMRKPSAPPYISDFRRIRRHTDGYIKNRPWSIDDAARSTSSSGSSLEINGKRVTNIGLLFSALETDYSDPVDDIIGYFSLYPDTLYPGVDYHPSSTLFVPKTSSRGIRAVHPSSNPRQDRGQYFENMMKHVMKDIVEGDSTFSDDETFIFIKEKELSKDSVLVCTDIHGATDAESHTFLINFWNLIFRKGIAESLIGLHSGDGYLHHHIFNEDGEFVEVAEEYTQLSGIKCGTRSNFSVGLALPHHFIVRCTIKEMANRHPDDQKFWLYSNPSTHYRLKGDDIFFALPKIWWKEFIQIYTQLANEAGFRVHDINEKGMLSHPEDLLYRAEWSKQTWSDGYLVSRIPHRLFFVKADKGSKISLLIWLSQYSLLGISYHDVARVFEEHIPQPIIRVACAKFWNFLIDKKLFGLPEGLRFLMDFEIDEEEQFLFAQQIFRSSIENGVFDVLFNNRQRLSRDQVRVKVERYTQFYDNPELIDQFINWQETHCDKPGKLSTVFSLNQKFSSELMTVFDEPYLWVAANLGIFSDEEKTLIRKCLPYLRISGLEVSSDVIDNLLKVSDILKRTQPHSLGKRTNLGSRTIIDSMTRVVTARYTA